MSYIIWPRSITWKAIRCSLHTDVKWAPLLTPFGQNCVNTLHIYQRTMRLSCVHYWKIVSQKVFIKALFFWSVTRQTYLVVNKQNREQSDNMLIETYILSPHGFQAIRMVNTLRPQQNGGHFADDIIKGSFMDENLTLTLWNLNNMAAVFADDICKCIFLTDKFLFGFEFRI